MSKLVPRKVNIDSSGHLAGSELIDKKAKSSLTDRQLTAATAELDNVPTYSIDKFEIHTKVPRGQLINDQKFKILKNECHTLIVISVSEFAATFGGFKSKICCSAPTKRFFELLLLLDLEGCKLYCIELAKDEPKISEEQAVSESYNQLKLLSKKYSSHQIKRDYRDSCCSTKSAFEQGKFGEVTGYYGNKWFELVLYPRYSKITGEPCIHSEFCITGAYNIKKRLQLVTINDCIYFDVKHHYEALYGRFIKTLCINRKRLGTWLTGRGLLRKLSHRQMLSVGLAATTFLNAYEILTAAELSCWLKDEKNRIKSEVGPKTEWENRILAIQSNGRFSDDVTIVSIFFIHLLLYIILQHVQTAQFLDTS